ncbi:MAG: hypothetical protein JKY01_11515 [Pseudomonadales bacterium]|nr:hypothetical protein [Pseudomonadales bacterium]
MDKLEVLRNAKQIIRSRLKSAPDYTIFQSIDAQLNYMQELLDGKISDRGKLKEINVGLYAIREFEESDPELAKELKSVQYIVDRMKKGLKID